jgi:hypothetical protein
MTSRRLEDGKMYGFAIVAEVTDTQRNSFISALAETACLIGPYGFLQCTCEKFPKITHINDQMKEYLGLTDEDSTLEEFANENIFFMIPFHKRASFRSDLDKALNTSKPISVKHTLVRSDETHITLSGWLSVTHGKDGQDEFSLFYLHIDKETEEKNRAENPYFKALQNAYNLIAEVNLTKNTVEFIHGKNTSTLGALYDVHMTIESAKNFWLSHYILDDDHDMMQSFFDDVCNPSSGWNGKNVLQTEFRVKWIDNIIHHILGVAIQLDDTTILFCIRDISNLKYSLQHTKEKVALARVQSWLDRYVENNRSAIGMVLFDEVDGNYALIYASEKLFDFVNISQNDYLRFISGEYPLEIFLNAFSTTQEIFQELITKGTVELEANGNKFIVTCTTYKHPDKSMYEIYIYDKDTGTTQVVPNSGVFARTFGHFDLFVDGVPITFSSSKEKELMALLIDRNGGTLTPNQAIGYLWEDEEISERISSRYRKLAMNLKNTLTKNGIEHILINNHGTRSINVSEIKCDYYELLAGNEKYINAFHNSYMSDYSWAEETLATLWDYS